MNTDKKKSFYPRLSVFIGGPNHLERYLRRQLQNSRIVSSGWREERCVWREHPGGRVEVILRRRNRVEVRAVRDVECFEHQSQSRAVAIERDVASNPNIGGK